jgi:hypothetical protein
LAEASAVSGRRAWPDERASRAEHHQAEYRRHKNQSASPERIEISCYILVFAVGIIIGIGWMPRCSRRIIGRTRQSLSNVASGALDLGKRQPEPFPVR